MLLTALASAVAIGGCNGQDGPSFRSALPPASAAADNEGDWTILLMVVKDATEHARRAGITGSASASSSAGRACSPSTRPRTANCTGAGT